MKKLRLVTFGWACFASLVMAQGKATRLPEVVGTWEGESICTIPTSPCHDEHVVYDIKPSKTKGVAIDMYKVVSGEREFMGTIECPSLAPTKLVCSFQSPRLNTWEFTITGKEMSGTLVVDKEKTPYRRITVKKAAK
jgi:hypothetical protein